MIVIETYERYEWRLGTLDVAPLGLVVAFEIWDGEPFTTE